VKDFLKFLILKICIHQYTCKSDSKSSILVSIMFVYIVNVNVMFTGAIVLLYTVHWISVSSKHYGNGCWVHDCSTLLGGTSVHAFG